MIRITMITRTLKVYSLFLCISLISSCITVGVYPLVENHEKSNDECKLDLYWIKEKVTAPKEDLCEITAVVPHYPWKDHVLDEALDQAYPQACKCGADGIYIHELGKQVLKVTAFRYKPKLESKTKHGDLAEFKNRLVCSEKGKNAYWLNGTCNIEKNGLKPINMRKRGQ